MKYWVSLLIALFLNAAANLSMKIGMKTVAGSGGLMREGPSGAIDMVLKSPILLAGLLCFALNAAFYMYALQSRALQISVAYPIMVGGGFALIAIVARVHPALQERLTAAQLAGVVFILIGILLIAWSTGAANSQAA